MSSSRPPEIGSLNRQARLLLREARAGAGAALARARTSPRLQGLDDDELMAAVRLVDAQQVVAVEHGFPSWSSLRAQAEAQPPALDRIDAFLEAVRSRRLDVALRLLARSRAIAGASFHAACSLGAVGVVEAMLERDPARAVAPTLPDGWVPLVYACASPFRSEGPLVEPGLLRCAELLLAHGADPNASVRPDEGDGQGRISALYFACVEGDAPLARLLLDRGADPNDGESVYHAAERDRRDCLEPLLEHGADLDGGGSAGNGTPLYFLTRYSADHPGAADARRGLLWLLEHGADPNLSSTERRETPLHRVAAGGLDAGAAEALLEHGADPNRPRADGKSPYALAVRSGQAELAELCLRHGARPGSATAVDALLGACMQGLGEAARSLLAENPGLLERLTDEERSAPVAAAGAGQVAALRVMAELGFDLAREGCGAGTPLHLAAWHGRVEGVRLLLELGVPVDARDREFGSSPLGWAAHGSEHCRPADEDYCRVIEALLDAGARREASVNRWNEPPESMGSPRVAALLRRRLR